MSRMQSWQRCSRGQYEPAGTRRWRLDVTNRRVVSATCRRTASQHVDGHTSVEKLSSHHRGGHCGQYEPAGTRRWRLDVTNRRVVSATCRRTASQHVDGHTSTRRWRQQRGLVWHTLPQTDTSQRWTLHFGRTDGWRVHADGRTVHADRTCGQLEKMLTPHYSRALE